MVPTTSWVASIDLKPLIGDLMRFVRASGRMGYPEAREHFLHFVHRLMFEGVRISGVEAKQIGL